MSNKILSTLCATAILLLSYLPSANAVMVEDNLGNFYDIVAVTDSFSNLSATLLAQPWWGNSSLASELAIDLGEQLGLPNSNGDGGPGFARLQDGAGVYASYFFEPGPSVTTQILQPSTVYTFAVVDASPVPVPAAILLLLIPLASLGFSRRQLS